jgi:thiol-disulfide isomerase/thioredoxin
MRTLRKTLALGLILLAVFCGSFYFFYRRAQKKAPPAQQYLILTDAVLNRPLPESNLVNSSGEKIADEELRQGKKVLVFMMPDCEPCDRENNFLTTVAGVRQDLKFLYVIPFGNKDEALKMAQAKYALAPFYDRGSNLSRSLEIYEVPVKVFLEDGVIKKVWLEATSSEQKQADFKSWLDHI